MTRRKQCTGFADAVELWHGACEREITSNAVNLAPNTTLRIKIDADTPASPMFVVYYHLTPIITHRERAITLFDGGWRSATLIKRWAQYTPFTFDCLGCMLLPDARNPGDFKRIETPRNAFLTLSKNDQGTWIVSETEGVKPLCNRYTE